MVDISDLVKPGGYVSCTMDQFSFMWLACISFDMISIGHWIKSIDQIVDFIHKTVTHFKSEGRYTCIREKTDIIGEFLRAQSPFRENLAYFSPIGTL